MNCDSENHELSGTSGEDRNVLQRGPTSYGYRLRHLLLLFVIVAIALTWWSRRQRAIEIEENRIAGTWVMVNDDGFQVFMPNGKPMTIEFARSDFRVDPFQEPNQIDFFGRKSADDFLGIYRWEGKKLRIKQAGPYVERPVSFSPSPRNDVKFKKGATPPQGVSIMTEISYLLERLPTTPSK